MRNPTLQGFMSGKFSMQNVYDFVKERLLEQKCTSNDILGCAYRGDNGAKCAIGWLIPDKQYNPNMEGNLEAILQYYGIRYGCTNPNNRHEFLYELQVAHDNIPRNSSKGKAFIRSITPRLNRVALKYGLNP